MKVLIGLASILCMSDNTSTNVCSCFKNILGRKKYTIQLYQGDDGMTKKCPLCQTNHILGIDDLLKRSVLSWEMQMTTESDDY